MEGYQTIPNPHPALSGVFLFFFQKPGFEQVKEIN